MVEKQHGLPRTAGRTRGAASETEILRPLQEGPAMVMDLTRQEKSLEALGRMLKTKREINGLTRRDVVMKVKIPMDQLESIEDGRLSSLPPVFAKGFLRAYANELGLDAEAILDDYRKMTGGYKNEPASRDALPPRYMDAEISSGGWSPGRGLAAALFVLVLGLAALFWFWPSFWQTAADRLNGSPMVLVQPEPAAPGIPEEPAALAAEPSEVPVVSGSLAGSGLDEDRDEAIEFVEAKGGELILVSQKDGVWLQLLVDGQLARHYWLRRGQTVVQQAETVVVVRTGQATALTASWNGRDLGPLSTQPVVEARFPSNSF